ncbi:MAG: hypothetical protein L0Z52_12810 [Acidobacteria bacterium]|nr:hypothetical protein [Acidobacteriota bacterium]
MNEGLFWSWMAILLLGAFHGINPGMGWLFAVALGMQERSPRAVWRAMLPLALGHALAIGAAIMVAVFVGAVIPIELLRWPVGLILLGLGGYGLFRHRHPRWGGMRVGMRGLTVWSFLMASAHGAGLMVLPIFLGMTASAQGATCHAGTAATFEGPMAFAATVIHGAGYLAVTALAAWIVYEKLGLGLLRKAWLNLDLVWAMALFATGGLTLVL